MDLQVTDDRPALPATMTHSSRRPPLPLACVLALPWLASACQEEAEFALQMDEVQVVERRPGSQDPEEAFQLEYHWLQAFDRSDIGDEVDVALAGDVFEQALELRLEDVHLEIWHDGAATAEGLLAGLRDCDTGAQVQFGRTLLMHPSEIDPPSIAPLELRYLESDPDGLAAAELLRDHYARNCDGEAWERVRGVVEQYGLMLRPVAELAYTEEHGYRTPLVLVLTPRLRIPEVSDLRAAPATPSEAR